MSGSRFRRVLTTAGVVALGLGMLATPSSAVGELGPPTAVAARASDSQAVVSWTAPVDAGGAAITGYTVTADPGGRTCEATGSPLSTVCTVTGLTNDTSYTFTVTAGNGSVVSAPSTPSAAVTPRAGTVDQNLIGTHGRVKWAPATVGATGTVPAWPEMIYNYQAGWAQDSVYTATDPAPADCTNAWLWTQILCDPAPLTDSKTSIAKPGETFNSGYTINTNNDPGVVGYVVIDLRQPRDFTTLRIWQMFSDGKVTNVELAASSETGDTWPTHDDGSWTTVVPRTSIGPGKQVAADSALQCPAVLDFSATRARYLRLRAWNDGSFGSPSYVEIGGAKLFFEQNPAAPETDCPPSPPTAVKAVAGEARATVSWTAPPESVTGYALRYSTDPTRSVSMWTEVPGTVPGGTTSTVVTGLTPGTSYVFRVKSLHTTNDPFATSPWSMESNPVTPTAAPSPKPKPKTVLKVLAAKGSAVPVGKRTVLVKSLRTNGKVTSVKAWCELSGNRLRGQVSDRLCDMTVKRGVTAQAAGVRDVQVTATPTCSRHLRLKAVVTAKRSGAPGKVWRDSWKVRSAPPVTCRVKATG